MAAQQFELKKVKSRIFHLCSISSAHLFFFSSSPLLPQDLQTQLDSLSSTLSSTLPASLAQPLLHGYLAVAEFWLNSSQPTKLACVIVGVNTVVLAAWKLGRWRGGMAKWWMHNPASGRQVTLLTSTFRCVSGLGLGRWVAGVG